MPVQYASASGTLSSFWLLIAIPLASAAVLLLLGKRADRWGHWLGVASVGVAFVLGLTYFFSLRGLAGPYRAADLRLFDYLPVGGLKVTFGLLYDPLSAVFVLLITGVGFLIHLYAVGYMAHDPGRRRFFGYFNLFVAAMLMLVLGDNYVMTFLGWEGVGLASYLLIAFWYDRPSAATAGKKAFIMNRVGDAGFVTAIFLMFATFGSVNFSDVFSNVGKASSTTILLIALLLLLGACGKSGQFPLQAWLPDAMEGPTPVSALIHAATMVTAGVYLIARSNPIFSANATAQTVVVAVGAFTLMLGAIIGCAKDDIKRVLAYSTVSQIGYMFLGVGLGGVAYALAIIHLLAHGFFKAGLFLGAGSVMHGMNDQTDIRRFGGLWRYMKITWATFGLGWLAILGIPPLSGFFSKEPIIAAAYHHKGWLGWVLGTAALVGSGLTAFYMTRLFVLTFHGPKRGTDDVHPHESPKVMTIPMIVLAVGSVFGGFYFNLGDRFLHWLEPVTGHSEGNSPVSAWTVTGATLVCLVVGVGIAYAQYGRKPVAVVAPRGSLLTRAARRDLLQDDLNHVVLVRGGEHLTRSLVYVDHTLVDGVVNGTAAGFGGLSGRLRKVQNGFARSYAVSMFGGAALLVAATLLMRAV
jgi:NADH-quinone oxidoreductase subunit L